MQAYWASVRVEGLWPSILGEPSNSCYVWARELNTGAGPAKKLVPSLVWEVQPKLGPGQGELSPADKFTGNGPGRMAHPSRLRAAIGWPNHGTTAKKATGFLGWAKGL